MADEVLSQDEVAALLHGVDGGAVETSPQAAPGEARAFDFASQARIVRGHPLRGTALVAVDGQWEQLLAAQIEDAEVELTAVLGSIRSSFGVLMNLKPGMVLPCDFDGTVTTYVEGVPIARGALCESRGQHAIQVHERVRRKSGNLLTSQREAVR